MFGQFRYNYRLLPLNLCCVVGLDVWTARSTRRGDVSRNIENLRWQSPRIFRLHCNNWTRNCFIGVHQMSPHSGFVFSLRNSFQSFNRRQRWTL